MWEVEKLLAEDSELTVIHLVRDPRGISVSRRDIDFPFNCAAFCNRFNKDSEMSARLKEKYPRESTQIL